MKKDKKIDSNIKENQILTETQYVDEFGNPIDSSLVDENGNYIGETVTQYVDEFGNPIDPSLVDENGNYIEKETNVQSLSLDQSQIANQISVAAGNDLLNDDKVLVTNVEAAPISSSEHQMDGKEIFDGMVTFDYNNIPITDIVNSIILDAINKGASDIHFDPFDEGIKIRIRIDGELNDYSIVPLYVKKNMITRIKIVSGMNITESRTPQDGAIRTELANKTIDLRVSCLPTNLGEKIVIRIMDYSMSAAGIEGLDFSEENIEKVNKMLSLPNGIILVTGATGSGKSTTVYSMLQKLNKEDTNIITVEDPIEMNIGGINQVQAVAEIGLDFATVLRSILRQDPDVIMIGEIRDEETAKIAVRASITGHIVLSTIHTNNSLNTIERLTDMNVERYLLGSALSGIISQKLSRRLCEKCKKLRPTSDYEKDLFKKMLNKDVEEIYEPVGCPECSKGYRGRIAIQEVLLLNQAIKDAIIKGSNKSILRKLVYGENGTITMLEDGLNKVLEGKTSFEEILKLIDLDDDLGSGTELGLEEQINATNLTAETSNSQTITGPININLTPELLAGLQIPQAIKPIIVNSEDIPVEEKNNKEEKTLLKKLTKRKKKKKKEPETTIKDEQVIVENNEKNDENIIVESEINIDTENIQKENHDEVSIDDENLKDDFIQINDDEIHDDDEIIEIDEIESQEDLPEEIIELEEDEKENKKTNLDEEDLLDENIKIIDEPLEERNINNSIENFDNIEEDVNIDELLDVEFEEIDSLLNNLTLDDKIENFDDELNDKLDDLSDQEIEETLQAISNEDDLSDLEDVANEEIEKILEIDSNEDTSAKSKEQELLESDHDSIDETIIDTLLEDINE